MTVLRTTEAIIDALGGNIAVAKRLATTPKAVSNWRVFDRFPAHTYVALRAALRRKRMRAPDHLWAMKPPIERREQA